MIKSLSIKYILSCKNNACKLSIDFRGGTLVSVQYTNSVNINEYGHYNRFPTTGWELSSRIVTVLNDMIQVVSSLDQEDRDKF